MLQSKEIIPMLEDASVLDFLNLVQGENIDHVALNIPKHLTSKRRQILQILQLNNKAAKKLPSWLEAGCGFTARSLEQCTAQTVALERAKLFKGQLAYDLTGGLGVDAWALASQIDQVVALEHNEDLHGLALFNCKKLEIANVTRVLGEGMTWLKHAEKADFIFIDPDRRDQEGGRHVGLSHLAPNVQEHMSVIQEKCDSLYVKLSPLTDSSWLRSHFNGSFGLVSIEFKNEVKEIGLHWNRFKKPLDMAIQIHSDGKVFKTEFEEPAKQLGPGIAQGRHTLLLEVPKSIRILGHQATYVGRLGLENLGQSKFALSHHVPSSFSGRGFEILAALSVKWKKMKSELAKMNIHSCHVIRSDFPETTKVIRRRLGVPEGEDAFCIFTKVEGTSIAYVCQRVC